MDQEQQQQQQREPEKPAAVAAAAAATATTPSKRQGGEYNPDSDNNKNASAKTTAEASALLSSSSSSAAAAACAVAWEERVQRVREHYERKGYRVRSGLQFGCELVLYADDLGSVHSDFCIHVVPQGMRASDFAFFASIMCACVSVCV
jgi:tRNA intron endonuclease, catalytic C-terminal domain